MEVSSWVILIQGVKVVLKNTSRIVNDAKHVVIIFFAGGSKSYQRK